MRAMNRSQPARVRINRAHQHRVRQYERAQWVSDYADELEAQEYFNWEDENFYFYRYYDDDVNSYWNDFIMDLASEGIDFIKDHYICVPGNWQELLKEELEKRRKYERVKFLQEAGLLG